MATRARDARLISRLPSDLKDVIEEAAASLGQLVSDFTSALSSSRPAQLSGKANHVPAAYRPELEERLSSQAGRAE